MVSPVCYDIESSPEKVCFRDAKTGVGPAENGPSEQRHRQRDPVEIE